MCVYNGEVYVIDYVTKLSGFMKISNPKTFDVRFVHESSVVRV